MMIDPQSVMPGGTSPPQGSGGQVDPQSAHYRTPDQGPFACGTCSYFSDPSTCSVLSAPVDPAGVCNLFESGSGGGGVSAPPPLGASPQPKLGSPQLLQGATADLQSGPPIK